MEKDNSARTPRDESSDEHSRLVALRDRLAKATGPDRELSDEIAIQALGWKCRRGEDRILDAWFNTEGARMLGTPRDYTASLDAAVTLEIEGLREVEVIKYPGQYTFVIWVPTDDPDACVPTRGNTEPLARCLARIEYEIAKEATDGEPRGKADPSSHP